MSCILTLELRPEEYERAFADVLQIQGGFDDQTCKLRKRVVAEVLSNCSNKKLSKLWKKYNDELGRNLENAKQVKDYNRQRSESCVIIGYTNTMYKSFVDYLSRCEGEFSKKLESIEDISAFRTVAQSSLRDKKSIMTDILLGKLTLI